MNKKFKTIRFTEPCLKMIQAIIEREGHTNFSAAVHAIVVSYYEKKYFNKYNNQNPDFLNYNKEVDPYPNLEKQEMTAQKLCRELGGDVRAREGGDPKVLFCIAPCPAGGKAITGLAVELSMMGKDEWHLRDKGIDVKVVEFVDLKGNRHPI